MGLRLARAESITGQEKEKKERNTHSKRNGILWSRDFRAVDGILVPLIQRGVDDALLHKDSVRR